MYVHVYHGTKNGTYVPMVPLVPWYSSTYVPVVHVYHGTICNKLVHVYFRGPSPQDVALRGVMQALVRIQAYMLADIVVAIPAVDLAIEAVV